MSGRSTAALAALAVGRLRRRVRSVGGVGLAAASAVGWLRRRERLVGGGVDSVSGRLAAVASAAA